MNYRHSGGHSAGTHCQKLKRQMLWFISFRLYADHQKRLQWRETQPFIGQNALLFDLTIVLKNSVHRLQRSRWLDNHWPWSGYTLHELITAGVYPLRGTRHKRWDHWRRTLLAKLRAPRNTHNTAVSTIITLFKCNYGHKAGAPRLYCTFQCKLEHMEVLSCWQPSRFEIFRRVRFPGQGLLKQLLTPGCTHARITSET